MSAATADRATEQQPGKIRYFGVAAVALFAGTLICVAQTTGYAQAAADAPDIRFVGVARAAVDNSAGSAGDETVEVYAGGAFKFASSGLSAEDVGRAVYVSDDQTVVLSGASITRHVYVGRIIRVESATSCWVQLDPDGSDPNFVDITVDIAGTNAAALTTNLNAAIAAIDDTNATGIYVKSVTSMTAFLAADNTIIGRKVITTNYTLADGVLTTVTDESANRLVISMRGVLKQS